MTPELPETPNKYCPQCEKLTRFCFCPSIKRVLNSVSVIILQHPQEPKEPLSTARLTNLALTQCTLVRALSRPNLRVAAKGLPKAESLTFDPKKWLVLYLGSKSESGKAPSGPGLVLVNKKSTPLDKAETALILKGIEGIVALDGTWSQSKALWWRNPWLLKLQRAYLVPKRPSAYGKQRKEPRPECLSTIESIAETLTFLNEPPEVEANLREVFDRLLAGFKKSQPA